MTTPPRPTAQPLATPTQSVKKDTRGVVVFAVLAALTVGALIGIWLWLAPRPTFDETEFASLARAKRWDDAEDLLRAHLRSVPADGRAAYLLAQILLERDDLKDLERSDDADEALDLLDQADRTPEVKSRRQAALHQLYRGVAFNVLDRWDQAEAAWLKAIELDPEVPEASHKLLDLYYIERRKRDARAVALGAVQHETDPHDRALLLISLLFHDAVKPDAASLVPLLERVTRSDLNGVRSHVALGLALVRESNQAQKGIETLEAVTRAHPDDPAAWEGLLAGLDVNDPPTTIAETLAKVPAKLAERPEFLRFRGRAAEGRSEWPAAIDAYRRALAYDPTDFETLNRLARVLRAGGEAAEADRKAIAYRDALAGLQDLHAQADATPTLGVEPHEALAGRIADAYEAMGRADEAEAWRRLGRGVGGHETVPVKNPS